LDAVNIQRVYQITFCFCNKYKLDTVNIKNVDQYIIELYNRFLDFDAVNIQNIEQFILPF